MKDSGSYLRRQLPLLFPILILVIYFTGYAPTKLTNTNNIPEFVAKTNHVTIGWTSSLRQPYYGRALASAHYLEKMFTIVTAFSYEKEFKLQPESQMEIVIMDCPMQNCSLGRDLAYAGAGGDRWFNMIEHFEKRKRTDWYLFMDDDTVVYTPNLLEDIATLPLDEYLLRGACSGGGRYLMVIGGGGMLFNRITFDVVYEWLSQCRRNYTSAQNDDGAWGKCVTHAIANRHKTDRDGGINMWGNHVCGLQLKTGHWIRHHIKNATVIRAHYDLLIRHMHEKGPLSLFDVPPTH